MIVSGRRRIVIVGALFTCAIAGVLALRWPWKQHPYPKETVARAKELQRIARPWPVIAAGDESATLEMLRAKLPASSSEEERERLTDGLRVVVKFLHLRSAGDVAGYIAWQRERGMILPDAVLTTPDRIQDYRYAMNSDPPAGVTAEGLYEAVVPYELAYGGGISRIRAVVNEPRASHVASGRIDAKSNAVAYAEDVSGGLGMLWVGGLAQNGTRWWLPPCDKPCLIDRDGGALALRVSVICESVRDLRIPLHFELLHDPAANLWFIRRLWASNVAEAIYVPNY